MEITPTSLFQYHPEVKIHVCFFINAVLYSVRCERRILQALNKSKPLHYTIYPQSQTIQRN